MADLIVTIAVQIVGRDLLRDLRERLEEPRQALEMAGAELERGVYPAFEAGDQRWPELAPWTQRERARAGYGAAHPILIRTGEYRASFEATVEGDAVALASDDPRFATLNDGGVTETGQAVPPRPLDEVYPESAVEAAMDAYADELLGG